MGKEQIANTSFSIVLNKVLADKYKDKVDTKDIDKDIKEQYGGKDQFESINKVCHLMIIKNRRNYQLIRNNCY